MKTFTAGICRINPAPINKNSSGFTLIELIVAMTIVMIVAGVMTAAFGKFSRGQNLKTATTQLLWELRAAAEQAKTGGVEVRVYFNSESGAYEIWKLGSAAEQLDQGTDQTQSQSSAVMTKQVLLPAGITFNDLTVDSVSAEDTAATEINSNDDVAVGWPDNSQYLQFKPDGATSATIELTNSDSNTRVIQVDTSGRVCEVVPDDNSQN
jgi:prepilin-type N-terminal cleavage/methylation domain-containing protein